MINYEIHKKFNYINGLVTEWVVFTDFILSKYRTFTTENLYTYITPVVKANDAALEPYYRIPNVNNKSKTFIGHMKDCYDAIINDNADIIINSFNNYNISKVYPVRFINRKFGKSKRKSFLEKHNEISFDYIICYKSKDGSINNSPIYFLTENDKFRRHWTHDTMTFETKEKAEEKIQEIYNNRDKYPMISANGYLTIYDCINKKCVEQINIQQIGGIKNVSN